MLLGFRRCNGAAPIVDDHPDFLTVTKTLAQSWGMRVYTAPNAELCVKLVQSLQLEGISLDIALLDLDLPDTNGIELSRRLLALPDLATFPHMLITSARNLPHKTDLVGSGISIAIEKPVPSVRPCSSSSPL
jgi:CheY-like chemotaxis protein